jgi:hypothetical protein
MSRALLIVALNPSPWAEYVALSLVADGRTVRTWFRPEAGEAAKQQFSNYDLDSDRTLHDATLLSENLNKVLNADETNRYIMSWARERMSAWRRWTYGVRALVAVPEDEVVPLVQSLNDGLASILGSVAPVRVLAWISLNSPGAPVELLERFERDRALHRWDGDLFQAIGHINVCTERALGEPVIYANDDVIATVL